MTLSGSLLELDPLPLINLSITFPDRYPFNPSAPIENTVNSVVSFTEFVRDFVNDPIGATANVLSAMWDTIKDPKFWALTTTSVFFGLKTVIERFSDKFSSLAAFSAASC